MYDLFILARKGAEGDYSDDRVRAAHARFDSMPEARTNNLEQTIIAGLPAPRRPHTTATIIRGLIAEYQGVTALELRKHLSHPLLREVDSRLRRN